MITRPDPFFPHCKLEEESLGGFGLPSSDCVSDERDYPNCLA